MLLNSSDISQVVPLMHFETTETTLKNGNIVKRLQAVTTQTNMEFLVNFITAMLPKIVYHRNHLRYYRSNIGEFHQIISRITLDIDFSENLPVPVKFEPQSLHWQATVHSGLLKVDGEKSYHPYLSNDQNHHQNFVRLCVEEMLDTVDIKDEMQYIVIESDNCCNSISLLNISMISSAYQTTPTNR